MINKVKLALYLKNNFNVMLTGRHGVGKTAVIKQIFEEANMKWKYFSAATMDPWVDFIGVPKSVKTKDGLEVLQLIKPEAFARDEVEALFFDEFNRASKKVKDAVMELIQFKSINGKKFENLKVVWASINPYDDAGTYDVEKLDPAIVDRFHILIDVPYEVDSGYLFAQHGQIAEPFIAWWKDLSKEIQFQVSPRRLDYAIQVYKMKGNLKDVLPFESNVAKLHDMIDSIKLDELQDLAKKSTSDIQKFFTIENTQKWMPAILRKKSYHNFIQHFHPEVIEQQIQIGNRTMIRAIKEQNVLVNTLTAKSKKIIKDTPLVTNIDVPNNLKAVINGIFRGKNIVRTTFIRKFTKIYEQYLSDARQNQATTTSAFFDYVFQNTSADDFEKFINTCKTTGYRIQTRIPSTFGRKSESQLFFGMLLASASKAYSNELVNKKIENLVKKIYSHNKTYVGSSTATTPGFIYGYAPENRDYLEGQFLADGNVTSFCNSKEFSQFTSNFKKGIAIKSWNVPAIP